MFDLGALIDNGEGWEFTSANGINDLGWIIGLGDNPQGEQAGFLLTPIEGPGPGPTPIPLPPGVWGGLGVMGAKVVGRAVRRGGMRR